MPEALSFAESLAAGKNQGIKYKPLKSYFGLI
jgi:hypothetical protein